MMNNTYRSWLKKMQFVYNIQLKVHWKFNNIWRRQYRYSGLEFVNKVLATAAAPLLSQDEYQSLVSELINNRTLSELYERHLPYLNSRLAPDHPHRQIKNWSDRFKYKNSLLLAHVNIYYVIPRVLRPSLIVETGVAAGEMNSFVLAALNQNQHGKLYSIDLKPQRGRAMGWSMDEGYEVGFLIPSEYRSRWSLTMGDATYDLPRLFQEIGEVDLFIHDSEHSFTHMMYEYSLGVKHVKKNGIIISDDIYSSDAFFSFFESMNYPIFHDERNLNVGLVVSA